ncbi:MAG TPA: hypothetical protein VFF73_13005, partial [Planctomycetota bacterium]|nr:hypothetical protein [Planctomycetota bacterium]
MFMPGGAKARLTTLALTVLTIFAHEARAQTAPLPEDEHRVQAAEEFLSNDAKAKLEETIAAVESERAPRRFFVVVRRELMLEAFARATAEEWGKRVQSGAETTWQPDSSYLIAVVPGTGEVAIECPGDQRDQLGLSPFIVRDDLAGKSFVGAARKNDLGHALERLVQALAAWLADADGEIARQRLQAMEEGDDPQAQVSVEPLRPLSERLFRIEERTFELEGKGVELPTVEQHLRTARKKLSELLAVPREHHEASARRARLLRDEMEAAEKILNAADKERHDVLELAAVVKEALDHLKAELNAAPGEAPVHSVELERARASLLAAVNEAMKQPAEARGHLYDAQNAILRARMDATPPPAPVAPPPSTSWKRILLALLVLVLVFA